MAYVINIFKYFATILFDLPGSGFHSLDWYVKEVVIRRLAILPLRYFTPKEVKNLSTAVKMLIAVVYLVCLLIISPILVYVYIPLTILYTLTLNAISCTNRLHKKGTINSRLYQSQAEIGKLKKGEALYEALLQGILATVFFVNENQFLEQEPSFTNFISKIWETRLTIMLSYGSVCFTLFSQLYFQNLLSKDGLMLFLKCRMDLTDAFERFLLFLYIATLCVCIFTIIGVVFLFFLPKL